ncbi:hypothetical protein HY990_06165 [Candidatus Micrarchaeota archaeon]|nr:hypothetical protein [Candidatus Micrarchaeota archaeon]
MRKIFLFLGLFLVLLFGCVGGSSKTNTTKNGSLVNSTYPNGTLGDSSYCISLPNGVNDSGTIELNTCQDASVLIAHICDQNTRLDTQITCPVGKICSGGECVNGSQSSSPDNRTTAISGSGCIDSDGGKFFEQAGEINFGSIRYADKCLGIYDLTEYFCENGNATSVTTNCGTGYRCESGACVLQEKTCVDSNANDQSLSGVTTQYGGGRALRTYSDICLGKESKKSYSCQNGTVQEADLKCPVGTFCNLGACVGVCLETDTAQNYGWKGSVQLGETNYTDYCLGDNKTLTEFYCTDQDTIESISADCSIGCYDGRCLNYNEVTCTTGGVGNGDAQLYRGTELLIQKNATCIDYRKARAYTCDSNIISEKIDRCSDSEICLDDSCQKIRSRGCYDLHQYNISQVIVTDENSITGTYFDRCVSDRVVSVYSCQSNRSFAQEVQCPIGQHCLNGACIVN